MQALTIHRTPRTRRLGARARRVRRYGDIGLVVARSGLVRRVATGSAARRDADFARALRTALERAGGVYVKLGQLLSTRPDLVSATVADELRRLQQEVAPMPTAVAHGVVADELGVAPRRVFRDLADRPVAAASVAQVHRAVLADGRPVAVKVQRPEVAGRVGRDVDILIRLAETLERRTRWAADQRLAATMRGFAESLTGELDFGAEADNLAAIRTAVERHADVVVPRPVRTLTRRRVLVMEWIDGEPLARAAGRLDPGRRTRLARSLLRCFLDQIFVVGVFHVDPHPGNVHLARDGRIALLDCGAIGRLDPGRRTALQAALVAIAGRDAAGLRSALESLATAPVRDGAALDRGLEDLIARLRGPGARTDADLLASFMDVLRQAGLALEPAVYGALRALAMVEATMGVMAPDLDLVDEAAAYGCELAAVA
jgi:ubiquinone biosynthesis protein